MLKSKLLIVSLIISIIIIIPILLYPAFGPVDDWLMFVFDKKSFFNVCRDGFNELIATKRFRPYFIFDQYLITRISFTAQFYYSVLFALALSGVIMIYAITKRIISKTIAYTFIPFLFLSITFTDNFYRTAPNEKYLFFLIPLFLNVFYKSLEKWENKYFWHLLIIANLSIYSKEIIFTLFGSFSFTYIIINLINNEIPSQLKKSLLKVNIAIIISCLILLIVYYAFIYSVGGTTDTFEVFLKNGFLDKLLQTLDIYKSFMFKVPIVTIFLPLILIIRYTLNSKFVVYFREQGKDYLVAYYDSLLISSYVYTLIVCYTGIGPFGRYLLPAVLFAFFPLIEYFTATFKILKNKIIKVLALCLLSYSLINSSIRGLEWGLCFKIDEYSFQESLKYIESKSKDNSLVSIYFADFEPNQNAEKFLSYGVFLQQEFKVKRNGFELYSILNQKRDFSKDWFPHNSKHRLYTYFNYSALQSSQFRKPQIGDLIIISSVNANKDTTIKKLSDFKIKAVKIKNKFQKDIYFPNPISLSVMFGSKPAIKEYNLLNDIYIVTK